MFRGFAPFVATRPKIIKRVIDELRLKDTDVVYELGCGRAGFLHAVRKRYPKVKLVGFEYALMPYFQARIQNALNQANLIIRRKNIFKVDLSEANVIYCYLNELMMQKLQEKFKRECKPGTVVVSYQYPLSNAESETIIELPERKDKVYVYRY